MSDSAVQEPSGIELRIAVCPNGVINVKRPESDRAHSVFVNVLGEVARCSCKGYHYRGECSHADGIEQRPDVVSDALAAAAAFREDTEVATDGGRETCDRCSTVLADAHAEPAGHTVETTDGEELCPDCADARCGAEIGYGECEREDCPYCDESDDEDPTGTGFKTATGWGTSERTVPSDEEEEVDRTPL